MMEDATNTTIGLSFSEFQARFLPERDDFSNTWPEERIRQTSQRFRDGWKEAKQHSNERQREKILSKTWAEIDADLADGPLCPGHVLHLSEDKYQDGDKNQYKPDGSFIADTDRDDIVADVPNWTLQKLTLEFKSGGTGTDPYDDRLDKDIETTVESREKVRGQIMSYAKHVFLYQHRTALLFLFVNGSEFRMMRWDRSGTFVTNAIDYVRDVKHTKRLLELLHSFSKLSPEEQGIDTTVTPLSPDSCGWKRMDALGCPHPADIESIEQDRPDPVLLDSFMQERSEADLSYLTNHGILYADPTEPCDHPAANSPPQQQIHPVFKDIRTRFRESLDPSWPRYLIRVGERLFLVGKPIFSASNMVGRGTRGYIALDWETQRLVFLKDTWRPFYKDLVPEGTTLATLNKAGVPYVPTYVCDGDVLDHATETSNYSPVTGPKKRDRDARNDREGLELRHLRHYRLVVAEVCLPSTEFENAWQLVTIICDCVQAHSKAVACKIIHRDVSATNVLILPRVMKKGDHYIVVRVGILSDWELSKHIGTKRMQPHRTGTWPFMSAHCLSNPRNPVRVPDELESFLYVLLYNAIRFLPTNITNIAGFVDAYFDGYVDTGNGPGCPPLKLHTVEAGVLKYNNERVLFMYKTSTGKDVLHPLNKLIETIYRPLKARYEVLNHERMTNTQMVEEISNMEEDDAVSQDIVQARQGRARGKDVPGMDHELRADDHAAPAPSQSAVASLTAKIVSEPSAATQALAQTLDTHGWFIEELQQATTRSPWPRRDRVEDQLAGYLPRPRVHITGTKNSHVSTPGTGSSLSKKRARSSSETKVDAEESNNASASSSKAKQLKSGP